MKAGMFFLVTAYVLSQVYRAFLAALSPVLEGESAGVRAAEPSSGGTQTFEARKKEDVCVQRSMHSVIGRGTAAQAFAL